MLTQEELYEHYVSVSELSKSYNDQVVLENINLSLNGGEIHGILGRNGVGKTTLIECMVGLRSYQKGKVTILGETNLTLILNKIGIQPQEANLFPRQTALETLKLFASFYEDAMDLDYLIKILELDQLTNKKVKNLSTGQRQRLLVSIALVGNPEFIILDEPTSGLDPQVRRLIWDCLQEMKDKGKTILLSTHYMEEAEKLCDTISILHDKHIVAGGSPQDIIQTHRQKMTDQLEDVFIHLTGKKIRGGLD